MAKRLGVTILVAFAVILLMASMEGSAKPPQPPPPPVLPNLTGASGPMTYDCVNWDKSGTVPPGEFVYNSGGRDWWIFSHNIGNGNFYGWSGTKNPDGSFSYHYPFTGHIALGPSGFTAIMYHELLDGALGYWVYTGTATVNTGVTFISGTYNHFLPNHIDTCSFQLWLNLPQ
jgi:hypothetical protein